MSDQFDMRVDFLEKVKSKKGHKKMMQLVFRDRDSGKVEHYPFCECEKEKIKKLKESITNFEKWVAKGKKPKRPKNEKNDLGYIG